jgi:pimeloyl-ACP methyl ester carboxylesterase
VRVNGVDLSYIDDGVGTPVVFVHGAWMDLRYWEPQREGVAAHHRFVAYTLRYHGTAPWPDDGKNYSAATHAADLAAFIHQLNAGPVHLVGLSMGGRLATMVALEHPDLLRSLTYSNRHSTTCWMSCRRPKPRVTTGGEGSRRFARRHKLGTL